MEYDRLVALVQSEWENHHLAICACSCLTIAVESIDGATDKEYTTWATPIQVPTTDVKRVVRTLRSLENNTLLIG